MSPSLWILWFSLLVLDTGYWVWDGVYVLIGIQVGGAYIGLATVYGLCVLMPAMYPCTRLTVRLYTYGEELHLWMTLGDRP